MRNQSDTGQLFASHPACASASTGWRSPSALLSTLLDIHPSRRRHLSCTHPTDAVGPTRTHNASTAHYLATIRVRKRHNVQCTMLHYCYQRYAIVVCHELSFAWPRNKQKKKFYQCRSIKIPKLTCDRRLRYVKGGADQRHQAWAAMGTIHFTGSWCCPPSAQPQLVARSRVVRV